MIAGLINRCSPALQSITLLACTALMACAPRQPAEIVERTVITQAQLDEKIGGQFVRIVQQGDTLYSISFALGLDVNKVAAWNQMTDTSRLLAGRRIRLTEPEGFRYPTKKITKVAPAKRLSKPKRVLINRGAELKSTSNQKTITKQVDIGSTAQPIVSPSKTKPRTHASASNVAKPQVLAKEITPANSNRASKWAWPLRGTLTGRFNLSKGQQGIDIQGQHGQTVKASAAGEVVYVGDSLKGYGNLIIIKHTADFLSAYAHNQSITVSEGQQIQQGQEIAKLGYNLKGLSAVQFQIRKNGNPVDPMLYLN